MSNEHRHESLAYLDDAKIAQIELDAVIADDFSPERQKRIAGLHQEINLALKFADVHAHLAVALAIEGDRVRSGSLVFTGEEVSG